jgi:hypothetical protein
MATATPPLHPDTADLVEKTAAGLRGPRAALYGLLVVAITRLRKNYSPLLPVLFVQTPFGLLLGFTAAWLMLLAVYWLLRLGHTLGFASMGLLTPITLVLLGLSLGLALYLKHIGGHPIQLRHEAGLPRALFFDRLHDTLSEDAPNGLGMLIGFVLGLQANGLYYSPDHWGLDIDGAWPECLALSVNNLFHGLLVGVADVYGWHLAPPVKHTFWTSTLFVAFRLTYDAYFLVLVLTLWQRGKVRHLVTAAEGLAAGPSPPKLVEYLRAACHGSTAWRRSFPDEYLFLCLAEKYLDGQYEGCRILHEAFPDIKIPASVRALFVAPDGTRLLEAGH